MELPAAATARAFIAVHALCTLLRVIQCRCTNRCAFGHEEACGVPSPLLAQTASGATVGLVARLSRPLDSAVCNYLVYFFEAITALRG